MCAVSTVAHAEQPSTISPECALRDVAAMTAIEDHGNAADIASEIISAAAFKLLEARSTCREGRIVEALALYGQILNLRPALVRKN
jgi:plasmid replication initiation protein